MKKLYLFMMISLDGYFEGKNHDLSWHNVDQEFNQFAANQLESVDTILFGRKTYQMMEKFWPTKAGIESDPITAKLMNEAQKVVVSNSLSKNQKNNLWKNTMLIEDNVVENINKLKNQNGKDIIVLGSNNLCITLLNQKLLDEIRIMVNPVILGSGNSLFQGLNQKMDLKNFTIKKFNNGNILLTYTPIKKDHFNTIKT